MLRNTVIYKALTMGADLLRHDGLGAAAKARIALSHLRYRLGGTHHPFMFLCPSQQCNLKCRHCYERFDDGTIAATMDTERVGEVLAEFARQGGTLVYLCSGEFLMRPDTAEIVRRATALGLLTVLLTNGLLLDEARIVELKAAGIYRINVSLDSPDPAVHDANRGTPGLFAHALGLFPLLRRHGINFQVWTFVTRSNPLDIERFDELAVEHGIPYVYVFFPILSGVYAGRDDQNLTLDEREDLRRRQKRTRRIALEFPREDRACTAGTHHFCVMPTGDVTICPPVVLSYGRIGEEPLERILARMRADVLRLRPRLCSQCPINVREYRESPCVRPIARSG